MQQLLWIETITKLVPGLALVLAPGVIVRILGLPAAVSQFWPRLLGATLIGLAGAFYIEGAYSGSRGLGLHGAIVVNLAAAAMLASLQTLNAAAQTRRGAIVLWSAVGLLILLSLAEIAA